MALEDGGAAARRSGGVARRQRLRAAHRGLAAHRAHTRGARGGWDDSAAGGRLGAQVAEPNGARQAHGWARRWLSPTGRGGRTAGRAGG
eukprot:7406-Chlamydomonas_euryale.AAC.1